MVALGWRKRQILSVKDNKMVVVKVVINKYLYALLGRVELVNSWWITKNKAFDNKTPNEVYQLSEEGRNRVHDYVMSNI